MVRRAKSRKRQPSWSMATRHRARQSLLEACARRGRRFVPDRLETTNPSPWSEPLHGDWPVERILADVASRIDRFDSQINLSRQFRVGGPGIKTVAVQTGRDRRPRALRRFGEFEGDRST